ncbi:unnamed protein product [Ectocarpus sp. 6 AP-2014]
MSYGITAVNHMHATLLLGSIAVSSLCTAAVELSVVRRAAFATASPPAPRSTTMPPKTKKRSSVAAGLAPAADRKAGDSSCSSRATKQGRRLKAEGGNAGAEAGGPTLVSCGDELVRISRRLHDSLKDRKWKGTSKQPVSCSYNVLEYASETNEAYTQRYGGGRPFGRAFVVGMNPGPWGMVQTGVPFGEVGFVRDWLKVQGAVGRPSKEHAKRPVHGFDCQRSEVSGTRLWGFFERRFGTADAWGDKMFVYNFCPLTFMSSSGGNITPDKLTPAEREVIDEACGEALAEMISALKPSVVVAVGNFAGSKCHEAVKASGLNAAGKGEVEVVVVNHPSPASPTGVKWEKATCLNELVLNSSKSKEIDRFLQ